MDKTNRPKKKNPKTTFKTEKENGKDNIKTHSLVTTWYGDPQVAATGNTGSLVNAVLFNQLCPQKPSVTGATPFTKGQQKKRFVSPTARPLGCRIHQQWKALHQCLGEAGEQ